MSDTLKTENNICAFSLRRFVRKISAWAWDEMLFDVSRVEWKYGRNDNGTPKNWTEWNNVRVHLREAGMIRQPKELDQLNAVENAIRTIDSINK